MDNKNLVTKGCLVHLKIMLNKYRASFKEYLDSDRCMEDFKRRIFVTTEEPTIDRYCVPEPSTRIIEVTNIAKMKDGTYEAIGYACVDIDTEVEEFNKKHIVYPCMLGTNDEIKHLISFVIH